MRSRLPLLVLLASLLLAGGAPAQEAIDPDHWGDLLVGFSTPQLAPGEAGNLTFTVVNPFPWAMENTTLVMEIHRFRSGDVEAAVSSLHAPPTFAASGTPALTLTLGTLSPSTSVPVVEEVGTEPSTPAGGYFSQGTYLVRFRMAFDGPDGPALLVSIGFFTLEEWAYATRDVPAGERAAYRYVGDLNLTYLAEVLGVPAVDGILSEPGFGVKQALPVWPFYLLAVGAVGAMGLAAYHRRREGRPPN